MRSLRIAHIADTHLGYKSNTLPARDEDFTNSWFHACRAIVDSSPDIILHAGDVFHNARPDWKAITAYTDGIKILLEANCPLFVIAGNHDTTSIYLHHTVFSFTSNIMPRVVATNENRPSVHRMDNLDTDVVLVPHKALLDKMLPVYIQEIMPPKSPARYRILVSHGDISKEKLTNELGSVAIPDEITKHDWDYIALGHLHASQPYGKKGWYSGSTERCGWSDYPADPAWTLTHLHPDGRLEHTQKSVPHMPMIQLSDLDCTNQSNEDIIEDALNRLEQIAVPPERSNIRIRLTHLPRQRKRVIQLAVQKALKKDNPQAFISVVIDEDRNILNAQEYSSVSEVHKGIIEHFNDFIEEQGYDPAFKEAMTARGLAALEEAGREDV